MEPAARVAIGTVIDMLPRLASVKHIRFVLFHEADVSVYDEVIENWLGQKMPTNLARLIRFGPQ